MNPLEQRIKYLEQIVDTILQANACKVGPPGPRGADGFDGKDGKDGSPGMAGANGRTPVKGVDYFDGLNGTNGVDGIDGKDGEAQAAFTSYVFYRAIDGVTPARPMGGSYLNPTPTTLGWTDVPSGGQGTLFLSSRIFSSNALAPQQDQWSLPKLAADSTTVDFEWSTVEVDPGTPTTAPENWSNVAEDATWMAVRTLTNGSWSNWNIVKIKGETGLPGQKGQDGSVATYLYAANGSYIEPPAIADRTVRNPAGWSSTIPAISAGFYLWKIVAYVKADNTLASDWQGPIRDTGQTGLDGRNGIDGVDGTNGRDGVDGTNGVDGDPGRDGQGTFKSISFTRSATVPATPTGGTWASPKPTTANWTDGVPAGTDPLYMSTRVFTTDGLAPQTSVWTAPILAADTTDVDIEWSTVVTNPGNPTNDPANWTNTASEATIWMAIRTKTAGTWSGWQISKIKGEKGQVGGKGPMLVPKGIWRDTEEYKSSETQLQTVLYGDNWYFTRADLTAPIPIGTLPTNTTYWNPADGNFEFVATSLLLAEIAYVEKLIARTLQTNIEGERTTVGTPVNVLIDYDPTIIWSSHAERKYYASGNIMKYDGFVPSFSFKEGTTNKTLTNEPAIIFFADDTLHTPTLVIYGGYVGGQPASPPDPAYVQMKIAKLDYIPYSTPSDQLLSAFSAEALQGANGSGTIIGSLDPALWCGTIRYGYEYNVGYKSNVQTVYCKSEVVSGSPKKTYRTGPNDTAPVVAQGVYLSDFSITRSSSPLVDWDKTSNIQATVIKIDNLGVQSGLNSGGNQRVQDPQDAGTSCTGPNVIQRSR